MDYSSGKGNITFHRYNPKSYQNTRIIIDKLDNTKEGILINQGIFFINIF